MDDKYPGDDFNDFPDDGEPENIGPVSDNSDPEDDALLTPDGDYRPGNVESDIDDTDDTPSENDVPRAEDAPDETHWPAFFETEAPSLTEAANLASARWGMVLSGLTGDYKDYEDKDIASGRTTLTLEKATLNGNYETVLIRGADGRTTEGLKVTHTTINDQGIAESDTRAFYRDTARLTVYHDQQGYLDMDPEQQQAFMAAGRDRADKMMSIETFDYLASEAVQGAEPKTVLFDELYKIIEADIQGATDIASHEDSVAANAELKSYIKKQFNESKLTSMAAVDQPGNTTIELRDITTEVNLYSDTDPPIVNGSILTTMTRAIENDDYSAMLITHRYIITESGEPAQEPGTAIGAKIRSILIVGTPDSAGPDGEVVCGIREIFIDDVDNAPNDAPISFRVGTKVVRAARNLMRKPRVE